jgi:hypothetical protein
VPRKPTTLEQFLRAVHRRQVALAVIERAGFGLVLGCAVATVLVGVVLWRGGENAWNVAGVALAAGAVVGAIAGAVTRPPVLASASEADRQLGTAELLSTAFTLGARSESNDPWANTVLALAADECWRHAPREVILRRLGVRAWGGILLAVAFVAVLTALSSASREAVAARTSDGASSDGRAQSRPAQVRPIVELTDVAKPPVRQHRAELSPEDQQPANSDVSAAPTPSDSEAKPDERDARITGTDLASPATGGSQATTPTPRIPAAERPNPSDPTVARADATAPRKDRPPHVGVGRASRSNQSGAETSSGGVVTNSHGNASQSRAPWTSNTWPQTVESAEQQLRNGRIPDDARDRVRG